MKIVAYNCLKNMLFDSTYIMQYIFYKYIMLKIFTLKGN